MSITVKDFTGDDWKKVALASILPAATMAGAHRRIFDEEKEFLKLWETSSKADWMPRDLTVYKTCDMLTMVPVGCAAYLVYKQGGGLEDPDTKVAMGLYGGMALTIGGMMACWKPEWKFMTMGSAVFASIASCTAYKSFTINKQAGYLLMPLVLWSMFGVGFGYTMWQKNEKKP